MANNLGSFIQTSLSASLPLQLLSSPYLSGTAGVEPSYSTAQTLGLIAGANVLGQSLFSSSGQTVSISSGIIAFKGQDLFAAPPCSLTVTVESSYSVLYISKKMSGAAPSSAQIGLIVTSAATTAEEALNSAQNSVSGLFVPLCVLSADSSANQTIQWTLDENSQYSSPILNQLGQISSWQGTTKNFIETQLSALMSDLTGFASWEQNAHNNQVYVSFNPNASANGFEVLGEWAPGTNLSTGFVLPCITGSLLTRTFTLTLCPHQMTASSPVATVTMPQIHNTYNGLDEWWAPSEDIFFPAACSVFSGGNFIGVQDAEWTTSGDLLLSGCSAAGQQMAPTPSTL